MKQAFKWMMLAAVLAGVGAARAEMVYLVEITDLQKKVTREIKTSAELKELKKTMDAEARVFPKALDLTKKEWEAVDKGAPVEKPKPGEKIERPLPATPFPSGMLAPRKLQTKGDFSDRDKAQKRLEQLENAEMDLLSKDAKRNQGRQLTDKDKIKLAREADRAAAADRAAVSLQTRIDELIKNPAGAAAPAAAGAAAVAAPAAAAK